MKNVSRTLQSVLLALTAAPVTYADIGPGELAAPKLQLTGGTLQFSVTPAVACRTYQLQWSDTMAEGTWHDLEGMSFATGGDLTTTTPFLSEVPRRFYRMALAEEFALIPAGEFLMGDQSIPQVGGSWELPVHAVQVSAFHMGKYEVSWQLWKEVRDWARLPGNGYTDMDDGAGKADNHPVQMISWWSMIKWCNARSEKEGLTPCYTVNGEVMRTGETEAVCNWNANGYRLPSEAEWEKAARGGSAGLNFPWGDVINHGYANYYNSNYSYEFPQNQGYHPDFNDWVNPCTAPVGSFTGNANGYGLYDMAGNVAECCWDWYSATYDAAPSEPDPRGPSSGAYRVLRGGSWDYYANYCRVAARESYYMNYTDNYVGFRLVRRSVP